MTAPLTNPQELFPPRAAPAPTCIACSDTGLNSKGGVCAPCVASGRRLPGGSVAIGRAAEATPAAPQTPPACSSCGDTFTKRKTPKDPWGLCATCTRKRAKLEAQAEEEVRELKLEAAVAAFDEPLRRAETVAAALDYEGPDWAQALESAHALAAQERSAYMASLGAQEWTRERVAWAAARLLEARQLLEKTKRARRAAVNREKRRAETREAFFEQRVLDWLLGELAAGRGDTAKGVRLLEACLRLEIYTRQPGAQIDDEQSACDGFIDHLGLFGAINAGVVRVRYELDPPAARAWLEENVSVGQDHDGNGGQVTLPVPIPGTSYRTKPEAAVKVVGLGR